jgi:hypothetical protein
MSQKNCIKRHKSPNSYISIPVIVVLVLGLFLCGACGPSVITSKYTSEQIIELALKHSPECRIAKPGESVSP